MFGNARAAIVLLALFTLLTGVVYPLAVTGVAQGLLSGQAQGELVKGDASQVIGSRLIGQAFSKPEYLHPRPSAAGTGYDPTQSGGSNMGPLNPKLWAREANAAGLIAKEAPGKPIPADAVTASGSGLDPHISPAYAHIQAPRIAAARGADPGAVDQLIAEAAEAPLLGFLGQPRVNVLLVNRSLDRQFPVKGR